MNPSEHPLWPEFVKWWKTCITPEVGPPMDAPEEWRIEWNSFVAGYNVATEPAKKTFVTNPKPDLPVRKVYPEQNDLPPEHC